jgi:hypothetical protein
MKPSFYFLTDIFFLSCSLAASKNEAGSPDGMRIDKQGNIFAIGPGGMWIFSKNAKALEKIRVLIQLLILRCRQMKRLCSSPQIIMY